MLRACAVVALITGVMAAVQVPNLPSRLLIKEGDISIGALIPVFEYAAGRPCGSRIRHIGAIQHVAAVIHAVNNINRDPHLLPNVTLGYAIADDCGTDTTALALTLRHFLPPDDQERECYISGNQSSPYVPVSGIVGPFHSSGCISVASFLSLVHLPVVSPTATNDELSNKVKYKYFMRLMPPDQYQAKAMVDLLVAFNWTYISLLNSEGVYGSNGITQVAKFARQKNICVAYSREIAFHSSSEEFDFIIRSLERHSKARVVVGFLNHAEGRGILQAAKRAGAHGRFIFVFSDTFNQLHQFEGLEDVALESFMMTPDVGSQNSIPDVFKQAETFQDPDNSFYTTYWKTYFDCELRTSCNRYRNTSFQTDGYIPLVIDSVMTFAHGMDSVLRENCDGLTQSETRSECLRGVNGSTLLTALHKTQFQGGFGRIKFDDNGDVLGKYIVKHLTKTTSNKHDVTCVGSWDRETESISIDVNKLVWFTEPNGQRGGIPESVCSKPCKVGQYFTYQDAKCCWICSDCRVNERLSPATNSCDPCPLFTWPGADRKYCEEILPVHLPYWFIAPLMQTASAIFIVICLAISFIFIKHRKSKLIKASSRELSALILTAIILSFTVVFFLVAQPNRTMCRVNSIGFSLCFTLAYAPLLAKVSRIFRIFEAAKQGAGRPKYLSPRAQLLISGVIISIQLIICTLTVILAPPEARLRMPVPTERYVELLCDLPIQGFLAPMAYNLVLIFVSCYYAFKTRKLPDNFNESRYIFLCVCSTVFLWSAFLPTYFAAFYAYHRAILLSVALIMNAVVMLLCLFVPKVYAVICVSESDIIVPNTQPGPSAANAGNPNAAHGRFRNRITPVA